MNKIQYFLMSIRKKQRIDFLKVIYYYQIKCDKISSGDYDIWSIKFLKKIWTGWKRN